MLQIMNERIKGLLAEKRISKTEISEKLNIGYSTLWRRLNGERGVDVDFLIELANVLGTTASYLMGETDNPNRENIVNSVSPQELATGRTDDETGANYMYWGGVIDEANKVLERGNVREISTVETLLKLAYDIISSGWQHIKQGMSSPDVAQHMIGVMAVSGGENNKNGVIMEAKPA